MFSEELPVAVIGLSQPPSEHKISPEYYHGFTKN
jgi:hypothetical protein